MFIQMNEKTYVNEAHVKRVYVLNENFVRLDLGHGDTMDVQTVSDQTSEQLLEKIMDDLTRRHERARY